MFYIGYRAEHMKWENLTFISALILASSNLRFLRKRGTRMSKPTDLVQGTLDLLIMKMLALEPMHGWAIAQRLKQASNDTLQVSDGSLYPALHKLEQEGWVKAEWGPSENNRRAKYYSLTRPGRKELEKETANWKRLSAAISQVVKLKEA
jgi:PadR family transcriptional regulator PadR